MSEYEMKLRAVFQWCMACEWSVTDLNMLFSKMYFYIFYDRAQAKQSDPKLRQDCLESRTAANDDLDAFMSARCFPIEIRTAVWWLVRHRV